MSQDIAQVLIYQKTLFYFKFMDLKHQITYTVSYCSQTSIKEAQC